MKIKTTQDVSNVTTWEELRKFQAQINGAIVSIVNGDLSFVENIRSTIANVTFPSANKTVAVAHSVGAAPSGYVVIKRSSAIAVFDGATPATTTDIYLQADAAGTVTVLIF